MISADKCQRIGKLASDLLAHGMAKDTIQATKMAEQMLTKSETENSNTDSCSTAMPSNEKRAQAHSSVSAGASSQDEMQNIKVSIARLNYILENQEKSVNELKTYIKKLEEELSKVKASASSAVITKPRSVILEKEKEQPQTHLVKEEKKNHPRSGSWQPGDIIIEKMFYSGPKKQ